MQHVRKRLTYANVMATLAFFFALGGTSYAVARIDGKLLKNRSVPGAKLKKNTVGPAEINEKKLGPVRSAAHSVNADHATNADRATSASQADRATTAGNAATLGGLTNGSFERTTRIVYGQKQANSTVADLIVDDPQMGAQVTTVGGGGNGKLAVRVKNTQAAGGSTLAMATGGGNFNFAPPGANPEIDDGAGTTDPAMLQLYITRPDGKSFLVFCTVDTTTQAERCYGIRSSA